MKTLRLTTLICAASVLVSGNAFAHGGHSHEFYGLLERILHTVMTNPLLFGAIGLALLGALAINRD